MKLRVWLLTLLLLLFRSVLRLHFPAEDLLTVYMTTIVSLGKVTGIMREITVRLLIGIISCRKERESILGTVKKPTISTN